MNKKGNALMEAVLMLPILVGLLYQIQWIGQGWITRIKNRMICRYTATYAARNNRLPSPHDLQQKFNLNAEDIQNLHIQNHQSTRWRFRTLWIQHHYKLWKGKKDEGFLEKIF